MKKIFFLLLSIMVSLSACAVPDAAKLIEETQPAKNIPSIESSIPTSTSESISDITKEDSVSTLLFQSHTAYRDSHIYVNAGIGLFDYDTISGQIDTLYQQDEILSHLGIIDNTLFFLSGSYNDSGILISTHLYSYDLGSQILAPGLELTPDYYTLSGYSGYLWLYGMTTGAIFYTLGEENTLLEVNLPFEIDYGLESFKTGNYTANLTNGGNQLTITPHQGPSVTLQEEDHSYWILDGSDDYLLFYDDYFVDDFKNYFIYAYKYDTGKIILLTEETPNLIELQEQWVIVYSYEKNSFLLYSLEEESSQEPVVINRNTLFSEAD